MLVRRRKVRIEIEQETVRMEVSQNSPAHTTVTQSPSVETAGTKTLNAAGEGKAAAKRKKLKSGEAL